MGKYTVSPSAIQGELSLPASKSHTLRAILFGALGKGRTVIHKYLPSPDAAQMIEACRLFGAKVDVTNDSVEIVGLEGKIHHAEDVIQSGNSGIVLRFCSAVGALSSRPVVVTGDSSIRHNRPILPLLEGLQQLGVSTTTMRGDGYAPVIIRGPLQAGTATIKGEDSQPVSALLIAGAFAPGPIDLHVVNPGEKPWLNLTLSWFERLGIPFVNRGFEHFTVSGLHCYEGFSYTVPGDWSTAAFPLAAALIARTSLVIHQADMYDVQGDKELVAVFKQMGADIEIDHDRKIMRVNKHKGLQGVTVDINDFVDSIAILAVVGCFAEGETRLTNAAVAKQKECNRIACIASELRKMGADITETDDGLIVRKSSLKGAEVLSHHDHRIAMALSVAAMNAEGKTRISDAQCISKTYPDFLQDFTLLGANIREDR